MLSHIRRSVLFLSLALYFVVVNSAFSQLQMPNQLQLIVDVALFRADSSACRVEIYQGINRDGLTYFKKPAGFVAQYRLGTKIMLGDSIILQGEIQEADTVASQREIRSGQQFAYTVPVVLKAGQYKIISTLLDENTRKQIDPKVYVTVKRMGEDSLSFSDIQFATRIQHAEGAPTPFDKNNLRVMPNPQAVFGDGLEKISVYAELYNLALPQEGTGHYRVDYIIENADGERLYRIPGKSRNKKASKAAIFTSFDISGLPSGRYFFRLLANDLDSGQGASVKRPFTVFRDAELRAYYAQQERMAYQGMDSTALNLYFDQVRYIATDQETKVFKELSTEGKQEFLVQFWKQRDPTPNTPRNEFKEDYIKRLALVKTRFSGGHVKSWRTDRARILLKYGSPDFIDRNPGTPDKNPFEIWSYETIQEGVIFVFIDYNDNNLFPLVHSSHRDELNNLDWEKYLYK